MLYELYPQTMKQYRLVLTCHSITANGCLDSLSVCVVYSKSFPQHILCSGVVSHQTHEQAMAPQGNCFKVFVIDQRGQRFVVCVNCEVV